MYTSKGLILPDGNLYANVAFLQSAVPLTLVALLQSAVPLTLVARGLRV